MGRVQKPFCIKLYHFNEQAIDSKVATASSGAEIGDKLNPVY